MGGVPGGPEPICPWRSGPLRWWPEERRGRGNPAILNIACDQGGAQQKGGVSRCWCLLPLHVPDHGDWPMCLPFRTLLPLLFTTTLALSGCPL